MNKSVFTTEVLKRKLKQKAREGKISCSEARQLAQECGASPKLVGKICDEMGIKIKDCELGCF